MHATSSVGLLAALRALRPSRLALLSIAIVGAQSIAAAQTVINPSFVEFDASADHGRVLPGGPDAVTCYVLELTAAGAPAPSYWIDLGKPTPQSGRRIRVPVGVAGGWPSGGPFTLRVAAVGPGGTRLSTASNPFVMPGPTLPVPPAPTPSPSPSPTPAPPPRKPCAVTLTPRALLFPRAGGSARVDVSTGRNCSWRTTLGASWIGVAPLKGKGSGSVRVTIPRNRRATGRVAAMTVGGTTLMVTQSVNVPLSAPATGTPSATGAAAPNTHPFVQVLPSATPARIAGSRIVVLNPTDADSSLALAEAGASASPTGLLIPARGSVTLSPSDVGIDQTQPTLATSMAPLVVERTSETATEPPVTEVATPAAASEWYFADGTTAAGATTTLVVRNPTPGAISLRTRYLTPAGGIETSHDVSPDGRLTVEVGADIAAIGTAPNATEVGAVVQAESGTGILVERAVASEAGEGAAGVVSEAGVAAASTTWWFATAEAKPSTGRFLTVVNPDAGQAADVRVEYRGRDERLWTQHVRVPASGRRTVWLEAEDLGDGQGRPLGGVAVGVRVVATTGVPVVAEMSRWRRDAAVGAWERVDGGAGSPEAGTRWAIADGDLTGMTSASTAASIAITALGDGEASVTAIVDDGTEERVVVPLEAEKTARLDVAAAIPALNGRRYALLVESTGPAPVDIVVERTNVERGSGAASHALAKKLP